MRAPWPAVTGVLIRRWPSAARDTRENTVWWWKQRLEFCCHRQGTSGALRAWRRQEGFMPGGFRRGIALSPPWYETYSLQNCKISFCFLSPLNLWVFFSPLNYDGNPWELIHMICYSDWIFLMLNWPVSLGYTPFCQEVLFYHYPCHVLLAWSCFNFV